MEKMIRDKTGERLNQNSVNWVRIEDDPKTALILLAKKVIEEGNELLVELIQHTIDNEKVVEEFNDIYTVLNQLYGNISEFTGKNVEEISNQRHDKYNEKGGFTKNYVMEINQ